jgi:hypothetical protein
VTERIEATEALRAHEHVVMTVFDGGEGVLVDLNTKRYYQLNETAMLVWRGVESGKTFAEIVGEMTNEYAVAPEQAEQSVARVLQNFRSYKLVS